MLDVEKLAETVMAGVRAVVAKELTDLRAESLALKSANAQLVERIAVLEARESPAPFDPSEIVARLDAVEAIERPAPLDLADVSEMVKAAVANAAEAMRESLQGRDGLGIAEVKQNADGELIVKMTNGETVNAGIVRGRDGLGFDDLALDYDGDRRLVFRMQRGELVKEFAATLPVPIDRGVWKADGEYHRGDAVTWAGSLWLAQKDAPEGKPEQSSEWRLAVKRGRDAKQQVAL